MKKQMVSRSGKYRRIAFCLAAVLIVTASGCAANSGYDGTPSIMAPAGPAAKAIAELGWVFFILGVLIFFAVLAYLVYALARPRARLQDERAGTKVVIYAGMVFPAVVLLVLFVLNTNVLGRVSAPNAAQAGLVIEVTGRQWWWEVRYSDYAFETANEIHIPVGKPVLLKLRSEDVIHSFWVPELHGKMDMIPGRVNDFWIQADQAGVYRGECAEYCGTQHAKMQLLVVAESDTAFQAWTAQMQQPVTISSDAVQKGVDVFLSSTCVQCHAIDGTDATGDLGPNLTHLNSRRTIGAGSLDLNRANLSAWIANPQGVKPGAKMPPSSLTGEELGALIDLLLPSE